MSTAAYLASFYNPLTNPLTRKLIAKLILSFDVLASLFFVCDDADLCSLHFCRAGTVAKYCRRVPEHYLGGSNQRRPYAVAEQ